MNATNSIADSPRLTRAGEPFPIKIWRRLSTGLDALQPLAAWLARLYVAQVFFMSGLTKLGDWDITLALFMDEYHVPLLPPALAAALGTAGEIGLPVLLLLGLGGRFAALGLSVVNLVAVVSLPEIAPAALQQHIFWGSLLAGLAVFGCGRWSLDSLLWPRLLARYQLASRSGEAPMR